MDYRLFVDLADTRAEDIAFGVEHGVFSLRARVHGAQASDVEARGPQPATLEWRVQLDFGSLLSGDELSAVFEQGVLLVTLPKPAAGAADSPRDAKAG